MHSACKNEGHENLVLMATMVKVWSPDPGYHRLQPTALGAMEFSLKPFFPLVVLAISVAFTYNPLIFLEIVVSYLIPSNKSLPI